MIGVGPERACRFALGDAVTESPRTPQRELTRAALTRVPAFLTCSERTLNGFLSEGSLRTFKRGETVSRRGERVTALSMLVTGSIEISATSPAGRRHVLHFLESGQLFNVIGLLDGGPAIHDAVAHEETLALLIPRAAFLTAVDDEPGLASAIIRLLCLRSRVLYDYIAENTLLPLRARCARLLLSLIEPYGERGPQGFLISLKLSQEELADMLGRSRQSVNKELRLLEAEGLIKTNYSQFIIVDLPALQSVAEGR